DAALHGSAKRGHLKFADQGRLRIAQDNKIDGACFLGVTPCSWLPRVLKCRMDCLRRAGRPRDGQATSLSSGSAVAEQQQQAAEMVTVQMRDDDGVDIRWTEPTHASATSEVMPQSSRIRFPWR